MAKLDSFYTNWTPRVLSILRIVAAFLMIPHGAQKLFGFLAKPGSPAGTELPPMMQVAGSIELFGGELAALYCFVFLFFAVAGGGPWSLDNLLWRRRPAVAVPVRNAA
jgi:putative oxidoreductase